MTSQKNHVFEIVKNTQIAAPSQLHLFISTRRKQRRLHTVSGLSQKGCDINVRNIQLVS